MTGNGIIRTMTLWAVLLLMASCSIYDEYPNRRQYDVTLQLADSSGNVLPDSVALVSEIYAFVNGVYQGKFKKEADGKVHVAFNDNDTVTFVAVAGKDTSQYVRNEPKIGTPIQDTWLRLHTNGAGVNHQPTAIYYGSISEVPPVVDTNPQQVITLRDIRSKVGVKIHGLREHFGDGNYRVVIEGLHSGICYDGTGGGDPISYEMSGAFDSSDDWNANPAIVLPAKGDSVRVKIYSQDGALIFDGDKDENGKPLTIKSSDNSVIVITVGSTPAQITVKIVPFEDVINSGFFQ